jgi:hypothetical protein
LTQVQLPDRGARVKTPARVGARGCVLVWARSSGSIRLGPLGTELRRGFDPLRHRLVGHPPAAWHRRGSDPGRHPIPARRPALARRPTPPGPAASPPNSRGDATRNGGGGSKPDRRPCPPSPTAIWLAHRARSTSDPEIAFRDRVLTRVSHPNVPLPGSQPGRAAGPEGAPWSWSAHVQATPSYRVRSESDRAVELSNLGLTPRQRPDHPTSPPQSARRPRTVARRRR